ncbi:phosphotyrosyl phosphatase activator [Phyllosticta capitalensis]|uniref:Serine/threonine-protein phosphatase 2A activator n=1 Tax=Phyllosticta capitalensis TaxID=121624 RepID=A0ABR1YMV9_9PEZI
MADALEGNKSLAKLDPASTHRFQTPKKTINEGEDVNFFLTSKGYADIMTWLLQLNAAMFPKKTDSSYRTWSLGDGDVAFSDPVQKLRSLLQKLASVIDEAPPDPGPRRFGNVSFRKWFEIVEQRLPAWMDETLPANVLEFGKDDGGDGKAKDELVAYLLGSFGSAQRLDYGTGHELSFLAFLGGIWKLGGFAEADPGVEERGIVIGVIEPYLELIRRLILTYTLEPAGSHGVWGLDDHSFVPYIFGSAQLSPPIRSPADIPGEGSLPNAPDPGDVAKPNAVQRERKTNMYFGAIGFIYDVKKGPFWEHSPILYDISGVKAGWAKINKGMLKMYNAEVLSKFPVVQHFPFGYLFCWEKDPTAAEPPKTVHTQNQPLRTPPTAQASEGTQRLPPQVTKGFSANPQTGLPMTAAPWARPSGTTGTTGAGGLGRSRQGMTQIPAASASNDVTTAAPWARSAATSRSEGGQTAGMAPTQAPWARKDPAP